MRYTRATIIGVIFIAVLFVLYIAIAARYAIGFMATGSVGAVALGVGVLVFPVLGLWALVREIQFGARSTALVETLRAEEQLPTDRLDVSPSGRFDRVQARQLVAEYEAAARGSLADDWRAWLRLSLVYDAAGRRRDARQAALSAIRAARRID